MNKSLSNCALAEDAKSPQAYYQINRKKKRDWRYCPRCNARAISRDMRKCRACGGMVLFSGDDGAELNRNMIHWFMWRRDLFGVEGYFNKDYWVGLFA